MIPIPTLTADQFTRFLSKIEIKGRTRCWLWRGRSVVKGRGQFYAGVRILAPRLMYRLAHDTDPGDLGVLHKCDNPSCCNPNHLYLGTNDDNVADRVRKNRSSRLGNRKLTFREVQEIRKSPLLGATLARKYGVTNTQISNIRLGKAWTHT